MHINQLTESKFLKKEDCGKGILVTIDHLEQQNVGMSGQKAEMKWCLVFHEEIKPMVLNTTNSKLIASITGSEETDDWHGHQIVLYLDPTVMNKGQVTGGIRARAPRKPPAPAAVRPAAPVQPITPEPARTAGAVAGTSGYEPEPSDDDVPF